MKRFDPIGRPYTKAMIIDNSGNYVLYSDYEELESEHKANIKYLYQALKDRRGICDRLEAENKKLKQASAILNSLSEEKTCPVCNNKLDYKPRIYHCNHCGSDFN